MDPRILFAVVALLVVYWLVRSRFMVHSNSEGGTKSRKHPQRRFGDRVPSGRLLQGALEGAEPALDVSPTAISMSRSMAGESASVQASHSVEEQVVEEQVPPVVVGAKEVSQHESDVVAVQASAPTRGSVEVQSEVDRLTELLQQRDRILARNRHAMEEVEKLKKKLFDKGREMEMLKQACARSDAALAHYRTRAQRAAMLEQQLAEAREQTDSRERELKGLRATLAEMNSAPQPSPDTTIGPAPASASASASTSASSAAAVVTDITRRKNQVSKKQLARQLREVEKRAENDRQNSLELRRIRSELESVCADRANAKNRIAELQVRVQAQQRVLETASSTDGASAEVDVLKQTLMDRQHQNDELKQQLARLSSSSGDSPSSMEGDASGSQDSSLSDGEI